MKIKTNGQQEKRENSCRIIELQNYFILLRSTRNYEIFKEMLSDNVYMLCDRLVLYHTTKLVIW